MISGVVLHIRIVNQYNIGFTFESGGDSGPYRGSLTAVSGMNESPNATGGCELLDDGVGAIGRSVVDYVELLGGVVAQQSFNARQEPAGFVKNRNYNRGRGQR